MHPPLSAGSTTRRHPGLLMVHQCRHRFLCTPARQRDQELRRPHNQAVYVQPLPLRASGCGAIRLHVLARDRACEESRYFTTVSRGLIHHSAHLATSRCFSQCMSNFIDPAVFILALPVTKVAESTGAAGQRLSWRTSTQSASTMLDSGFCGRSALLRRVKLCRTWPRGQRRPCRPLQPD